MEAVAHNPAFAKKAGVPTKVGKEFVNADKEHGMKKEHHKGHKAHKMSAGGAMPQHMEKVKTAAPSRDGIASKGHTKGTHIKMAGNTIGTGPLVNTMKRGGKVHHKK